MSGIIESAKEAYSHPNAKGDRPRILCVVDGPNWIFRRHVFALEHYLSDAFEFVTGFRGQAYHEEDFDLIYPLEFNMVNSEQIHYPEKYVTGIRSFIAWADWDFLALINYLVSHFQQVHVVSKSLFDLFSPYIIGLQYLTHGVDTDFFYPLALPSSNTECIRLGWAGNRKTIVKGFDDFIQPLTSLPGVELLFHGFADRNLTYEEMPNFYNSIDAYICASSFEGNNNSLLEAAAMGRAIVTTPVGTVPEYLVNNISALIVDRDIEQIKSAVIKLRDDPALRIYLGQNARKAVIEGGWSWKDKSEDFRFFFRSALASVNRPILQQQISLPTDLNHYVKVLQTQLVLLRELRAGYATHCSDLERQIAEIKESETFLLVERIKSLKIMRSIIKIYQQLGMKRR